MQVRYQQEYNSNVKYKIYFQRAFLCSLILLSSSFFFAQNTIKVKDCVSNLPLENVLIFTENGNYLGISDKNGECLIESKQQNFLFSGLSINDTVVNVIDNLVCVSSKVVKIDEFITKDESVDTKTYFLNLIEKSLDTMLDKDTVVYYKFTHTIEIPDSNWKETISGYFKVDNYSYKIDKEPIGFISIKDYNINKKFKESQTYQYHLTKLRSFKTVTGGYLRNKRRRKLYKKYVENVVLQSDTTSLVFKMDFTRYLKKNGVSPKFKVYFDKNGIITKWDNYSVNQNLDKNNHLTTTIYTKKQPKIVEKSKTYSLMYNGEVGYFKKFEIELIEKPSIELEFKKMYYYSNYQWLLRIWSNAE